MMNSKRPKNTQLRSQVSEPSARASVRALVVINPSDLNPQDAATPRIDATCSRCVFQNKIPIKFPCRQACRVELPTFCRPQRSVTCATLPRYMFGRMNCY